VTAIVRFREIQCSFSMQKNILLACVGNIF
jgi:hypothetical protein